MPEIVFGRVENPEELDLEPIEVNIAGYTVDKEEVVEKFFFRPIMPTGAALDVIRRTNDRGEVEIRSVLLYLDKALMIGEKDRWDEFMNRDDLMIEQETLVEVYRAVTEIYAARPTKRRSDSVGGRSQISPTSQAAARSKAYSSKKSRSRSA